MSPLSPHRRPLLSSSLATVSLALALTLTVVSGRLGLRLPGWDDSHLARRPTGGAGSHWGVPLGVDSSSDLSPSSTDPPSTFNHALVIPLLLLAALLTSLVQFLLLSLSSTSPTKTTASRWARDIGLLGGALCSSILILLAYPVFAHLCLAADLLPRLGEEWSVVGLRGSGGGGGAEVPGLVFGAGVLLLWGGSGSGRESRVDEAKAEKAGWSNEDRKGQLAEEV